MKEIQPNDCIGSRYAKCWTCIGLALTMGKIATVGLAPAIFGPVMNVTGSLWQAGGTTEYQKKISEEEKENCKS